jgi:hypothetical protein
MGAAGRQEVSKTVAHCEVQHMLGGDLWSLHAESHKSKA